jgi:hypothetical protein
MVTALPQILGYPASSVIHSIIQQRPFQSESSTVLVGTLWNVGDSLTETLRERRYELNCEAIALSFPLRLSS